MEFAYPKIRFQKICPVDEAQTEADQIFLNGLCQLDFKKLQRPFWDILSSHQCDRLVKSYIFCTIDKKTQECAEYFTNNFGFNPHRLFISWTKKTFFGESFCIQAPTGFGKTTFGMVISQMREGRVCFIVPTKFLAEQIYEKLSSMKPSKQIVYLSRKTEITDFKKDSILIITTAFLHKNFPSLPKNFDLVFIDDADSLLRNPKNIDKVLNLIGYTTDEIQSEWERLKRQKNTLKENKQKSPKGQVIVSSATLTPKSKRLLLFKSLLGFEIAESQTHLRNIVDSFIEKSDYTNQIVKLIKTLGNGGLIFFNADFTKQDLEKISQILKKKGIISELYFHLTPQVQQDFIEGKIDVLLGLANIRNPLSRGIDLPQTIQYAIFIGEPIYKIPLEPTLSPKKLFILSLLFRDYLRKNLPQIPLLLGILRRIRFLSEEDVENNPSLKSKLEPLRDAISDLIQSKDELSKLQSHYVIRFENNKPVLVIADPKTYLQASGRTSRLYPKGLSLGLSIIISSEMKLLEDLKLRLANLGYEINFHPFHSIDIKSLIEEMDKERKEIGEMMKLDFSERKFDPVTSCLVIVESPTKAKTIASFFGKPARKTTNGSSYFEVSAGNRIFTIVPSVGHLTDLVEEGGVYGVFEESGQFIPEFYPLLICSDCKKKVEEIYSSCPYCGSKNIKSKIDLINILRKLSYWVDEVLVCTDPDAEGEKIAFDLYCYLYPLNRNVKRIEIHEITPKEFIKGVRNWRVLNPHFLESQLARRIADRWVGFSLSELLKKQFHEMNISAGRVQTPVLDWIIENAKKQKEKVYNIRLKFDGSTEQVVTSDLKIIKKIKESFTNKGVKISLHLLQKTKKSLVPSPPYTTDTLLKDAVKFLQLDTKTIMSLAQKLFEIGFITYHRTDSTHVSYVGQEVAKSYMESKGKKDLFVPRSWGKVGTHECIRPVKPIDQSGIIEYVYLYNIPSLDIRSLKLYGLIFQRFLASQAKSAEIEKAEKEINIQVDNETLLSSKEVVVTKILQTGFLDFYNTLALTSSREGEFIVSELNIKKRPSVYPYTEGTLVEEMKQKGLGRPSTYSLIIETLKERGYVIEKRGYLFPTRKAFAVLQFLKQSNIHLISESFTRELEKTMDLIRDGKIDFNSYLKDLYRSIQEIKK